MLDYHRPSLVVLVKTHLADHQFIRDNFNFTNMEEAPTEGHSGGIALFWSQDIFNVDTVATTHQEMHSMPQVIPHPHKWIFSVIYASPHSHDRNIL